jgi:hypothetical protein
VGTHKDVVLAEAGASAALAGLVLVFLGVLVTSYQGLLGRVGRDTLSPIRGGAWLALGVFGVGLTSLTLDIIWLASDGGQGLYVATLVLFFTLLAGLVGVAVFSARLLLR